MGVDTTDWVLLLIGIDSDFPTCFCIPEGPGDCAGWRVYGKGDGLRSPEEGDSWTRRGEKDGCLGEGDGCRRLVQGEEICCGKVDLDDCIRPLKICVGTLDRLEPPERYVGLYLPDTIFFRAVEFEPATGLAATTGVECSSLAAAISAERTSRPVVESGLSCFLGKVG